MEGSRLLVLMIAGLLFIGLPGVATTEEPVDEALRTTITPCSVGPAHPAECTTGPHEGNFTWHGIQPIVFDGFVVSEVRWGPGSQALYLSCEVRTIGGNPLEPTCIPQGVPPPAGTSWTHRCYTFLGSIGVAGCAVTQQTEA